MSRNFIDQVERVVIKVGSSTLTYSNGRLNLCRIEMLVRQISDLKNRGIDVVLVTSGAIGAGMSILGYSQKPDDMGEKQACAAVGQGVLMQVYEKFFAEYGHVVGQILLTKEDIENEKRYENAHNSLNALLRLKVIPIINENDAVAVDEIKVGDNDTLSALVSNLIDADLLILLSDIDGLYDKNPCENLDAKLISIVNTIDENIENSAGGAGTKFGTGGMHTKIEAAKIATAKGVKMIIANGAMDRVLSIIFEKEEVGTLFL